jgi:glycosyltransferase involved in cell wall biosynthesis
LRPAIRQALNLPQEGIPVILFVGRLIPKKQPHFLLEAYARVRREVPCALLFVGSGQLESSLRARVADDRIPDVYFAGFLNRTQIGQAYIAADIFSLPSREHETWGVVVNEAMNFSLPVVVTDKVGCAGDLVLDGENGFIVSSQSWSELADRLGELIRSAELRQRFGRASRQIIGRWTYEDAVSGVLAAIRAAVSPERWSSAADRNSQAVGG